MSNKFEFYFNGIKKPLGELIAMKSLFLNETCAINECIESLSLELVKLHVSLDQLGSELLVKFR